MSELCETLADADQAADAILLSADPAGHLVRFYENDSLPFARASSSRMERRFHSVGTFR